MRCIGPASDWSAAYMDWLNARSLRRLGSIRATLRVPVDDELGLLAELGLLDEPELQAAAASTTAVPTASMTGRASR